MDKPISYKTVEHLLKVMEREDYVQLCLKYRVCLHCGGDLDLKEESAGTVRCETLVCWDCGEKFLRKFPLEEMV